MCDALDEIIVLEQRALRLRRAGDLPAALLAFRDMEARCVAGLAQSGPHDVTPLHLAAASRRVADTLLRLGRWDEALVPAKDALRRTEAEAENDATDVETLRGLELSLDLVGRILDRNGKGEAALAMHERSVRIARGLAALAPDDPRFQHDLYGSLELHAWALEDAGHLESALGLHQQMLRITQALEAREGEAERALRCGASVRSSMGEVLQRLDRPSEAETRLRESVDAYRRLLELHPTCEQEHGLAVALRRLASVEARLGQLDAAVRHAAEGVEFARRAVAQDPHAPSRATVAAAGEALLAVLLTRQGQPSSAVAHAKAARARLPPRPRKPRPRRPRPERDEPEPE